MIWFWIVFQAQELPHWLVANWVEISLRLKLMRNITVYLYRGWKLTNLNRSYFSYKENKKMTENKKAADYFDSVRNCPVYEGDVYYDEGLICPYYRVVKTVERGFCNSPCMFNRNFLTSVLKVKILLKGSTLAMNWTTQKLLKNLKLQKIQQSRKT